MVGPKQKSLPPQKKTKKYKKPTENLKPTGFSLGVLHPWAFLRETPRGSLSGRLHFGHRGVARQVLDGPDVGRAGGNRCCVATKNVWFHSPMGS